MWQVLRLRFFLAACAVAFVAALVAFPAWPMVAQPTSGPARQGLQTATFAGGCFWCMEPPFEAIEGVSEVISGYIGGARPRPSYRFVSGGRSGYLEAVQVHYDPTQVSYAQLLEVYWLQVDPTDDGGQFVDRGSQYKSAIFYHDEAQRKTALKSKQRLQKQRFPGRQVVTELRPYTRFWKAEAEHQDFYKQSPEVYARYKAGSGRPKDVPVAACGLKQLKRSRAGKAEAAPYCEEKKMPEPKTYNKPEASVLREKLSPMAYEVTQSCGTEPPFRNAYWDHKEAGIYVDVVTGEPLFSSQDKFDSGTGWPSFTRPIEKGHLTEKADMALGMRRVEVRSSAGDSHLGHVFPDGPGPAGERYCINSAALRFVPVARLEAEGYGEFLARFEASSVPSQR